MLVRTAFARTVLPSSVHVFLYLTLYDNAVLITSYNISSRDHQSGLPEHVIFKEQVRSTTMLPAIERVGGKTSNGDQQGGRGEPDAALSHERHGEPIGAIAFATSRSATVVTVCAYRKRSEGGTGESRGVVARQW